MKKGFRSSRSSGYVPNFARAPKIGSARPSIATPRIPLPAEVASAADMTATKADVGLLSSAITSAVTQAILFGIPNILAASVANEKNQNLVTGTLYGSAAASGAYDIYKGFKQGGLKGTIAPALAAGVTAFTA